MSAVEQRLAKVAAHLTPTQAVLAWLMEAQACGSLDAYVLSLRDAPDEAFPLIRLHDQMEQAVRGMTAAMSRKAPTPDEQRAVRLAYRDAGFLYYLATHLNWRIIERKRANWLHVALVVTMLRGAALADDERELDHAWAQAREALHTAYVQQGVAEAIAMRYFGGQSPLFPDVAEDVALLVTETERVVEIVNEVFAMVAEPPRGRRRTRKAPDRPTAPPRLEPLDFGILRAAARAAIAAEVALPVDLAKAEAFDLIGERKQGEALVARHVWSQSAASDENAILRHR
jgi:hypothetical protein